ncbi:MAG: hypothetical protein ACYC9O_03800 [Candidatus Latescibacterota bacterium]
METGKQRISWYEEHLDLINPEPAFIPVEIQHIALLIDRNYDYTLVNSVYEDVVNLFEGKYPGYRACNTFYHDLEHTTDTFLAMARLMHGAVVQGVHLGGRSLRIGLIAALLHDTGYIQLIDDTEGTGAKYTLTHIDRSIEFARRYLQERGFSEEDFRFCWKCLLCTGIGKKMSDIDFHSDEEKLAGQMLGAADLLGQMADRKYLEKLLFLYHEFLEGGVSGYESEFDLLRKTLDFHRATDIRLAVDLGNVYLFMRPHFKARWNLDTDPYMQAIQRNIEYIRYLLTYAGGNYREHLRRGGVVKRLRERGW